MISKVKFRRRAFTVSLYILFISVALIASMVLVSVTGGDWTAVLPALIDGSTAKPGRWGQTLTEAAPLLLIALGAIITTRMNLVNIGQEGQLLFGAAVAAMVATRGSGPIVLVISIVTGCLGGAIWSSIAGVLKYWRKVPIVVSTLLMVFISSQLTGFMLTKKSILLDRSPNHLNKTQTSAQLTQSTRLPYIHVFGNDISTAVFIAVGLAVVSAFVLNRTLWGFKLDMVGMNARIAHRFGVPERNAGLFVLAVGGGLAGLAGSLMFAAGTANYRYTPGFSNNVGWEGLLVALVSRNQVFGAVAVALVFAGLRTGSGFLASTGIQREIVDVVRALLVVALLLPPAYIFLRANLLKHGKGKVNK